LKASVYRRLASMLALLLTGVLLAAAPPVPSTDETAIYEGEQPEPSEPGVIEPVEITLPAPELIAPASAPIEPEPEPPPFTPPRLALPPPPPPPTGAGRLVGGSFAIALGLGAASVVIVEAAREGGSPQFVASTFIPLGLTGIGVGTYLLVRGGKARGNYNEWRAHTNREALPTGDGLVVAGVMSTLIGGVSLVAAAVQARDPDAFDRPLTPTLFGVGATGVAVGVGTLTWGMLRRSKYLGWRQSTFLSARGRVTPTIAPLVELGPERAWLVHGASFGLSGRL
jgi:hypothetical protein